MLQPRLVPWSRNNFRTLWLPSGGKNWFVLRKESRTWMQHVVEDSMSKCRTKSVKDAKCIIVGYPPVNCVPLAPAILRVVSTWSHRDKPQWLLRTADHGSMLEIVTVSGCLYDRGCFFGSFENELHQICTSVYLSVWQPALLATDLWLGRNWIE